MNETVERIFAGRNFGDLSGYQVGEIKRALSAAYRAGRKSKGGLTRREADGAKRSPCCGAGITSHCVKCGRSVTPRR